MDHDTLIVGCGNLLRGDDAVGPRLVRRLWELGLGDHVRLSDGGTAGMNVAFDMRGMAEVVLVDACRSGSEPGTIFEAPGDALETPPLEAINLHNFRWDHALSFARWLLKDEYPRRVSVILIEGEQYQPGAELSPRVAHAMEAAAQRLATRFIPAQGSAAVELNAGGYLLLPRDAAERWFGPCVLAECRDGDLWLTPLATGAGGLMVKQRNAAGDRAVLVKERLPAGVPAGRYATAWDASTKALRVLLSRGPIGPPACAIDERVVAPRAMAACGGP